MSGIAISIDPGFASTGYAVWGLSKISSDLIGFGVIKTEKSQRKTTRVSDDDASRCCDIAEGLHDLIKKYNPDVALMELPISGAKSATALKCMSMASACAIAAFKVLEIPVEFAAPQEVKLAAIGKRSATKGEMIAWAKEIYPHDDYPKAAATMEHIADAIAVFHKLRSANLVRAARTQLSMRKTI